MSLEAALEEERLGVLRLLNERGSTSLSPTGRKPPSPRSRSMLSMLSDVPKDSRYTRSGRSRSESYYLPSRSTSGSRSESWSLDDDPNTDSSSYYYTSDSLRRKLALDPSTLSSAQRTRFSDRFSRAASASSPVATSSALSSPTISDITTRARMLAEEHERLDRAAFRGRGRSSVKGGYKVSSSEDDEDEDKDEDNVVEEEEEEEEDDDDEDEEEDEEEDGKLRKKIDDTDTSDTSSSSDMSESESGAGFGDQSDSDADKVLALDTHMVKGRSQSRDPTEQSQTLMQAMEDERKSIVASTFKVKSLLNVDNGEERAPSSSGGVSGAPPPSMAEYAAYKRRIIHPRTAFDDNNRNDEEEDTDSHSVPYTANSEEVRDARRAAQLTLEISPIHSTPASRRTLRTMERGNLRPLSEQAYQKLKTFIVATDLSPEALYALEWTIGTVLRDGNVLYAVCTLEYDPQTSSEATLEDERVSIMSTVTNQVSKLLNRTRLQVHVVIEVIHCKIPKHMLTEIIDHVCPTLVILGARGRSAISGVLLGSFSNYIVSRSPAPVMVARRKLHKTKNKELNVRLANNLRHNSLSEAKVD